MPYIYRPLPSNNGGETPPEPTPPSFRINTDMEQLMITPEDAGDYVFLLNDDCELILEV